MERLKVGIIGNGNMGGAIAKALLQAGIAELRLNDVDRKRSDSIASDAYRPLEPMIDESDVVIIAIKPQFITREFLESIARKEKSYISIAAGMPLEVLDRTLGARNLCRFMPNLAAGKLKAVTAIAFKDGADESFRDACMRIAGSFGSAFELSESQFSAFIGISGSLIAYALEFVHDSAMAGVREGIPYDKAKNIVAATLGSASALLSDGESPAAIIPRICSAAGTTIAGMAALVDKGFSSALFEAVKAASDRSKELENKSKEMIR